MIKWYDFVAYLMSNGKKILAIYFIFIFVKKKVIMLKVKTW